MPITPAPRLWTWLALAVLVIVLDQITKTWVIGNFVEGEVYSLLVEAVDSEGRVIQSLPSTTIEVPAAPTFTRVDGFNVAWN